MAARMRDVAVVLGLTIVVVILRATAPSDLATGDQPYQVDYIRDIALHGNWLVQHLGDGTPAAKPPLYNWLAAPLVVLTGSTNPFFLKLPSVLAGIALVLLTWDLARRIATEQAALMAAALLVTTTMYVKLVYFARTDMLLAALIALQIHAAIRQRPTLYWVAAALAMLTKGPVGILLPLLTMVAWWAWRGELRVQMRAMHVWLGLTLALLPFIAWFAAAVAADRSVWNQLIYAETLDRFASHSSKAKENRHILYYIPHFLVRMAPASLFSVGALWRREWRDRGRPIALAVFWLLVMLAFLSLVPSKRADRLFPLLPAACILAGWLLAAPSRATRVVMYVLAAGACGAGLYALSGVLGGGVVQIAGVMLVMFALLMLAPRYRFVALIGALLVVNAVYQHRLSAPAATSSRASSAGSPSLQE